jgi:hypothetical protein
MAKDKNRSRRTDWLILAFVIVVVTLLVIEFTRAFR